MAGGPADPRLRPAAVADVLADQRTALLLDPTDRAAWRGAVARLRDRPELQARLGAAALAELRGLPTWQARARRILGFLDGAPAD
jgi:glycosyltransferase involved in cell wall biosynthesis